MNPTHSLRTSGPVVLAAAFSLTGCMSQGPQPDASLRVPGSQTQSDVLRARLDDSRGPVMVVAHRACWVEGAPENSLAALSRCVSLGVEMAEIDVARTKDGELVLLHDATLDRTTDASGPISSWTLADLDRVRLRAGAGGPGAPLTEERVPTLREALILTRGRILLNLDLKADVYSDSIALARELGVENQVLTKLPVLPGDPRLTAVAARGDVLFMPIIRQCDGTDRPCTERLSTIVAPFQPYDPVAFEVVFTDPAYLAEGAAEARRAGERVWINTLSPTHAANMTDRRALSDPDGNWGRAVDLGADIIQTDQPGRLIAYLEGRRLR